MRDLGEARVHLTIGDEQAHRLAGTGQPGLHDGTTTHIEHVLDHGPQLLHVAGVVAEETDAVGLQVLRLGVGLRGLHDGGKPHLVRRRRHLGQALHEHALGNRDAQRTGEPQRALLALEQGQRGLLRQGYGGILLDLVAMLAQHPQVAVVDREDDGGRAVLQQAQQRLEEGLLVSNSVRHADAHLTVAGRERRNTPFVHALSAADPQAEPTEAAD